MRGDNNLQSSDDEKVQINILLVFVGKSVLQTFRSLQTLSQKLSKKEVDWLFTMYHAFPNTR